MLLSVVLCTEIWAIFGSFELDVSTFLAVSERSAEVSQQGGETGEFENSRRVRERGAQ